MSNIEWIEQTWNPVTGCKKISPGCTDCYAERLALGCLKGSPRYRDGFNVTLHDDLAEVPLRWEKPRARFGTSARRAGWPTS